MFPAHSFRPRLLPLEDRITPTCLVYARQDTLYIQGDNSTNAVGLVADGSTIRVGCDNAREVVFPNIRSIRVDLAGGDDTVTALRVRPVAPLGFWVAAGRGDDVVNLDGVPGAADSTWIDLSSGKDIFVARFRPPFESIVPIPENVSLTVDGGDGADTIDVALTDVKMSAGGRMRIDAYGGAGADLINVDLSHATIPGQFDVSLAGYAGDDHISVHIQDTPTFSIPPEPLITHSFGLVGGAGTDMIEYITDTIGGDVLCEGNDGDDTIVVVTEVDFPAVLPNPPPGPPPVKHFGVAMHGGAGNDHLRFDTNELHLDRGELVVEMNGDAGEDDMNANVIVLADRLPGSLPAVTVGLMIHGGRGDDAIRVQFGDIVNATVTTMIDLGQGDDVGIVVIGSRVGQGSRFEVMAEEMLPLVTVAVFGGAGDDRIRMVWPPVLFVVEAFVDGGTGFDFGEFSPGVQHVNVERFG